MFSVLFLIVGLFSLLNSESIGLWSLALSLILLLLAGFAPQTLSIPNKLWFKFGLLLSGIMTPIVMTLIYILTILPTGLIMWLLDRDLLGQKLNHNIKSYWIKRDQAVGSMKNQF